MQAACVLCGHIISVNPGPMLIDPGQNAEVARAVAEISEFDLMAARMVSHLGKEHQNQTREMTAVMHLAAKVYSMTWAESDLEEPNYSALRDAWRKSILNQLETTSQPMTQADAVTVSDGSSIPPSGSNEKKSERKASS